MHISDFSDFYHRSYPYIYQLVGSGGTGSHSIEDTIQEVYLAAWIRFRNTSHPNPFGWLVVTARHKVVDQLRRQFRDAMYLVPLDQYTERLIDHRTFDDPQIERLCEAEAPYRHLLRFLDKDELSLLLAYYEDGVPVSDLSSALGISPHACHMRLHRARKKLTPLIRTA